MQRWIDTHLQKRGNHFLCRVDECFMTDSFNLTGLAECIPNFLNVLQRILNTESTSDDSDSNPSASSKSEKEEEKELAAETLYGLIHARFIMTRRGSDEMKDKFYNNIFGVCPRVTCATSLLPIGLSDAPCEENVKTYCPMCDEIFEAKSSKVRGLDGAFFGISFPHMFFMMNPECRPAKKKSHGWVPKLFGFRIHPSAYQSQEPEEETKDENEDKEE
ncbi:Oidioi.mRNA.OKI2018_I69.chr2.g6851.t1.cds [Oikopleura dioica]|uniref:Casein kinase II subunit beta n=1 Tax=Oikopleura dioica TaxID=34765 RepID=A0ABN7T949_OIKDI|nr:Oidioi.mRNA.OKI2018_I69.chr2.g6851.t1.cds [Oikopleura dioica]